MPKGWMTDIMAKPEPYPIAGPAEGISFSLLDIF